MKKIIPYILIFIIIVNLFTPISVELRDGKIKIENNKVEALGSIDGVKEIKVSDLNPNDQKMRTDVQNLCLNKGPQQEYCFKSRWTIKEGKLFIVIYTLGVDRNLTDDYTITIKITDSNGVNFNPTNPTKDNPRVTFNPEAPIFDTTLITDSGNTFKVNSIKEDKSLLAKFTNHTDDKYDGYLIQPKFSIAGLISNTNYTIDITLKKKGGLINVVKGGDLISFNNVKFADIKTQTFSEGDTIGNDGTDNTTKKGSMPACAFAGFGEDKGTFPGCIAQGIYYLLFQTTSYIFALAGTLFDNAFAYSVDDNSYRSDFVVQGWKVVRDFCNMFFIFILLYVAFTTILNTHGAKTKETIINVIIIGLLINFSLFATQVIIDASNVLARVFYNSDTIKITEDGANGVAGATGTISGDGVLPISAALVNKVNPQNIIINAGKVNIQTDTRNKGVGASDVDQGSIDAGTFILVTLLATAVNIVGLFVFLSVALIFITRVIGLWLAMIFVPFTFLSYTIPAMQDFEMVGWKKWWPETLKMAFLAPVFIFFMYLIIKFLNTGLGLLKTDEQAFGLSFVVGIVLPFAFIMIFLMKAKDIAKDLSGKMGQQITDGLSKVGGFALGAATGGAAVLGRATLGRAGNAIADSDKLKAAEAKGGIGGFMAGKLRNVGTAAGKGSMDVRGIKVAGKGIGDVGIVSNVGKPKEGGFTKIKEDQKIKAEKRAKELELGENSPEKKHLREEEASLKKLENANSKGLEEADREIARTKAIRDDANAARQTNPDDVNLKTAAIKAQQDYKEALAEKQKITNGSLKKDGTYNTHNGKIGEDVVEKANKDVETASVNLTAKQLNSKVLEQAANEEFNTIKEKHDEVTASIAELEKSEQEATEKFNAVSEKFKNGTASTVELDRAKKEVSDIQGKRSEMTASVPDIKSAQEKLDAVKNKNAEDIKKIEEELNLAKDEADRVNKEALGGTGKSINRLKNKFIPGAEHHIHEKNNERKEFSAQNLEKTSTKIFNLITTGGQYSTRSADIAAHNIRMGIKTESSGGGHGGGGGGGDSHAAHPAPAPKAKAEAKPAAADHGHGGGHDAKH